MFKYYFVVDSDLTLDPLKSSSDKMMIKYEASSREEALRRMVRELVEKLTKSRASLNFKDAKFKYVYGGTYEKVVMSWPDSWCSIDITMYVEDGLANKTCLCLSPFDPWEIDVLNDSLMQITNQVWAHYRLWGEGNSPDKVYTILHRPKNNVELLEIIRKQNSIAGPLTIIPGEQFSFVYNDEVAGIVEIVKPD